MKNLLAKLGYEERGKLQFLNKRTCGMWLIWVSIVIFISTLFGGEQKIQPNIFYFGYVTGLLFIVGNKSLNRKLSFGSPSKFQKRMSFISIIFMFVLIVLIGGPYYSVQNDRMIWLGAFLATGIHFFPFSLVHGKLMIVLGFLVSFNSLIGILDINIPFYIIAYINVFIMGIIGFIMFFSKNPLNSRKTDSQIQ